MRSFEQKALLIGLVVLSVFGATTANSAQKQGEVPKPQENVIDKAGEQLSDASKKVGAVLDETRERRAGSNYYALFNYSPLDFLVPGKMGATVGLIKDPDKSWELEYLRGSISVPFIVQDLGKLTDERISLIGRSYFGGNSFNFSYGISYFNLSLHLGDALLNRVTSGAYPSLDLVEVQSYGFNVAIGNRWVFQKNISFGVDWVSLAQPVLVTKRQSVFMDYASNQKDKDDVDTALKIMTYFPRLAFFKLQLGILF